MQSALLLAGMICVTVLAVIFAAWRRYLWASKREADQEPDTSPYRLEDRFGLSTFVSVPHQKSARWLTDIFALSAARYPDHVALQIPATGETLTYAELDARAEAIATALSHFIDGPDQVVAVAMSQDNWQIVATHLGILKAGGTLMFLDTTLPETLISHMLDDAKPVVVATRGGGQFRDLPTLDVLEVAVGSPANARAAPTWLDDPRQRLATIFYTSGTTGLPKGVECPHAGYVNLALSYADYFDLLPGRDATTLTSSLGYDGSISEMYSAWVSGCAVVLLTKDQVRSGPDLLPVLRQSEVTVLFCPPVLLTTLTTSPEIDLPYPLCRYIVPAGEAFPNALVEPWTRGRRQIINTYGPTEASTDTSRQSLRPGEPITIGSPFANVSYVILEPDGLTPLPFGEAGELCIGGVHLARSYRNLPEQTAQKFIDHPEFGRLYRSGDRCRIDPKSHRTHFLGRIDHQLKVRGHRVEAQAVEDILQSQFPEIEAAVLDYQNEALVAFVSAPSVVRAPFTGAVAAPSAWVTGVREKLAEQLPETSVPSRIFLVEQFVMKPVSGKIDRKQLPNLAELVLHDDTAAPSSGATRHDAGRATAGATAVTSHPDSSFKRTSRPPPEASEVLEICRAVFEAPIDWDDAFADVGGHSIVIARLAQRLHAAGRTIPVRSLLSDCNTARKIADRPWVARSDLEMVSLPQRVQMQDAPRDDVAAQVLSVTRFTILQMLFSLLLYAPSLVAFVSVFGFVEIGSMFTTASLWAFIVVGVAIYAFGLLVPFAVLVWALAVKTLMGGHPYKPSITPGVYPKWSRMHLRVWCYGRIQSMVLVPLGAMYRSAPLMAFAIRQLGAKVGGNLQCAPDANLEGPLELLSIGDDVVIQTGAYVHTVRWDGPDLHIGPIRLEDDCKIGMRAGVGDGVTVGRGAWVAPFAAISRDVAPAALMEGAPARPTGRHVKLQRTVKSAAVTGPIWGLESLNIAMQIAANFVLAIVPTAIILWAARHFIPAGEAELTGASFSTFVAPEQADATSQTAATAAGQGTVAANYFATTPLTDIFLHLSLYAVFTLWLTTVVTSILGCLFIRWTATPPGIYGVRSLRGALLMYRVSLLNGIQGLWTWTISGQYLRALAGLRFLRVGASECDVMFNLVPEVATVDQQVFWSNGSFTNVLDYSSDHLALRLIDMPRHFFSGNNCVIEHGAFPDNFLVGVSTPCSDIDCRRQMRSRLSDPVTVAGNPPLQFASAAFEDETRRQKQPGFGLFLGRILLNDVFSIAVLRGIEALIFTLIYITLLRYQVHGVLGAVIALVLAEAALIVLSVSVKQAVVGNHWGTHHTTPFWSWRHFGYFFAQDCFFAWSRGVLNLCAGTVLANPILRWFGCKVGARTIINEPMQCSDWNAVRFGRDCMIGGFLQLHTFENMMLKVKETHIRDRATVAFGATVMSGAVLEPDTTLLPMAMALKEMNLPSGRYEGSPAEATCRHPGVAGGAKVAAVP